MNNVPYELIKARVARQRAALNMQVPDRVPLGVIFLSLGGDMVPAYSGITQAEFAHDYDKTLAAAAKFNTDFQFDVAGASIPGIISVLGLAFSDVPELAAKASYLTGPMHRVLKDKYSRFPGNEIAENATPQFIGGTFMEAEEYEEFTEDPLKFVAEKLMPRVIEGIDTPKAAMETWTRFGVEAEKYMGANIRMGMGNAMLGYGFIPFGLTQAPFDVIADYLRGVTNTVLDVRRHPEALKKACEALVEPLVNLGLASQKVMGADICFIPLHMNEYLSPKLYKEFYWPTLKEVIVRMLDQGVQSMVFFEGHHEQHLETILELPRNWGVAYFEKTDIVKAKEVLKDNCCVAGGLPVSLLVNGTPEEIDTFIKDLLEKVKPGGGFMLTQGIAVAPATTPPENLKAVIEAVEKYGYYE